ncbi:Fur family transcriptional regulator [Sulfobacillus harzensis]|uniref:Transcriptional repressor n=1 Tax=Sulfobacillus harzensis TaxID=2729629 RepID=A0A7Y0L3Z4_9FIRM|nr:transcriptional repressor [Sulfobacillus harzensis]NMP21975.1 transcriptional repressor [Sulfobacillus harzensis]
MAQLSSVYRRLEEGRRRLTPQRERIIKIFLERPGQHLSAEEVHQLVKRDFRDIGMATVYRALELFTQLEILQRIHFNDGRARYEINRHTTNVHRHHHLVCLRCGRVEEFQEDLLDDMEDRLARERGFQVVDHELKFYGTCQQCNRKQGGRVLS